MATTTVPAREAPAESRLPRRIRAPVTLLLLVACAALATASLAFPAGLGYDPWAWLIWGASWSAGSWTPQGARPGRPLPVLITAALAPFGDAAPALWLVIARTGALFAMVLTFRLAARLVAGLGEGRGGQAARWAAGGLAVLALLLTPGAEARWIRHVLQGNVEPLAVALCLWAVERHLAGRPRQALVLGALAGLVRPEVWPLLVLYAAWMLWRRPAPGVLVGGLRRPGGAGAAVVRRGPSGLRRRPLAGATRARVVEGSVAERRGLALGQVAGMVPLRSCAPARPTTWTCPHARLRGPASWPATSSGWRSPCAARPTRCRCRGRCGDLRPFRGRSRGKPRLPC